MADDSSLIIKINGDSKKFNEEINKVSKKTEELQSNLNKIASTSGVAFAALIASAGLAVKSFFEANKVSEELKLSLQNQGIASDKLLAKYNDLATAIQNKTGVDDDAVKSGLSVLQNFVGQREITAELAQAMVDLSIRTGSVESAAQLLGKSITGPTRGLKQFGVEISDTLPKEERIAKITEQLSQKLGGFAENANRSQGGLIALNTQFGNLLENIGERLAPAVTSAANAVTSFLQRLNENKPLLDFIVEIGKIGAIATGFILALSTAGIALVKISQAFEIAKIAVASFGAASRIAVGATGLGLLLVVAAEVYNNWNTIFPVMQAIFQTFTQNITKLGGSVGTILTGIFKLDLGKIKEGIAQAGAVIDEGLQNIKNSAKDQQIAGPGLAQDGGKKAAADKARADEIEAERIKNETLQAQKEEAILQEELASARVIELKKQEIEVLKKLGDEKYEGDKESLIARQEEIAFLLEDARIQEEEAQIVFRETLLAENAAFNELSITEQDAYIQANQQKVLESINTERTARQLAINESLKQRIDGNNRFLAEQQRFGTAYALINQTIQSNEVQGFARAASELAQLQQSKNATLKAIGKAAAIADITIRTAQSAMAIFAGFSTIPFIGVGLGVAGAAAAIAFGAEKIANVTAAADGGIITGGTPGQDSVPAMLMPGELVVPTRNFSEVVNAVANQRAQQSPESTSGVSTGGTNPVSVTARLEFSGDGAEKFLTARQVEARSLGTFREAEVVA